MQEIEGTNSDNMCSKTVQSLPPLKLSTIEFCPYSVIAFCNTLVADSTFGCISVPRPNEQRVSEIYSRPGTATEDDS